MQEQSYQVVTGVVIAIIVFLLAGFFILTLVAYIHHRKKKYAEEKLRMQDDFHREILLTQLEIQEQTFRNISQEIHDNIGQSLSFVKLNINTVNVAEPAQAKEKLLESRNILSKVIQDLRDISRSLNTDFINDTGLVNALDQQLSLLKKAGAFVTKLTVTGTVVKFPPQKELVLFRVGQELLNNIVKHAEASHIEIRMRYEPEKLVMTVQDNGKGFDLPVIYPAGIKETKGLGIRNMHNRMDLIGGRISIVSERNKGTVASIELPL